MTKLREKILLILGGVLIAVLLLEMALRIAGAVVFYIQERHNHVTFAPNEYRILCLGESTTALGGEDAYPSQLQEILNSKPQPHKFTVINQGIISTTTDYIVSNLDRNLKEFRPQMVVLMMGINDKAYLKDPNKNLWWENLKYFIQSLRVCKLVFLIYEHAAHKIKDFHKASTMSLSQPQSPHQIEDFLKALIVKDIAHQSYAAAALATVQLADRYKQQGNFKDAENLLLEVARLNPANPVVFQEMGDVFLSQDKNMDAARDFETSLSLDGQNDQAMLGLARANVKLHSDNAFVAYSQYLNHNPRDYWVYVEAGQWLAENNHEDLAQLYLAKAIELKPYFDDAYLKLGQVFDRRGLFTQEEDFYLKFTGQYPNRPRLLEALGQFYQRQGKADLARKYFARQAQQQMAEYYPATLVNFQIAVSKIISSGAKVVVMQYPVRDIEPLENYLGTHHGIIFVENKKNFKEALAGAPYGHYFKDNFAYDFGHCTRAGNELIARNLAEVILNSIKS